MKRLLVACVLLASACAAPPRPSGINPQIAGVIAKTAERAPETRPEAVQSALLPPLRLDMPGAAAPPQEQRFDLSVTNAPASQVFLSIVSGTRYSMLVHPSVSGTISVNLKNVTVEEALAAIRDLYGYEYRVTGTRIFIEPLGLQTRVFQVNYLIGQRRGSSDVRVQSGAVSDVAVTGGQAGSGATGAAPGAPAGSPASGQASRSLEASRVSTQQLTTFWTDLCEALVAIAFPTETTPRTEATGAQFEDRQRNACNRRHSASDRSIVVSPQSGVIVVRASPTELRAIDQYLRATRLSVERQVMLEAKIIEVTLAEAYQSGINWAVFHRNAALSAGQVSRGAVLQPKTAAGAIEATGATSITGAAATGLAVANPAMSAFAGSSLANHSISGGGVFGLAVATNNFATLLTFLETQGQVQVLSSPRIATINNQKALLKVGTDEFFVTSVSSTSTATATATQTAPTITVQPFFSGIVLDVTPQIDENSNIILHIHPAISEVTESTRVVNLGGQIAEVRLPLARSSVSETDTIVRVTDGNIVAIGGLMSVDIRDDRGGLPGLSEGLGRLFRNTDRRAVKKELVILLKPTIIESDREWERDLRETRERLDALGEAMRESRPGAARR
ncbi:MAG: secretin N-terminal domain-containing protein [Betaproteobacteria bacterium]